MGYNPPGIGRGNEARAILVAPAQELQGPIRE